MNTCEYRDHLTITHGVPRTALPVAWNPLAGMHMCGWCLDIWSLREVEPHVQW